MPFKNQPPLYHVWQGMLNRCRNPNNRQYKDYGGRGIFVCDRWKRDFKVFIADMGPRPSSRYSLDRIDNDGPDSPENCKWSTRGEQQRNRRCNRHITFRGETMVATDWARRLGIKADSLLKRIDHGYPLDVALTKKCLTPGLIVAAEKKRARVHCKNGHPYTKENTNITPQGWRNCRRCRAERAARERRGA